MYAALGVFLLSTFVLVGMLPSPDADYHDYDSYRALSEGSTIAVVQGVHSTRHLHNLRNRHERLITHGGEEKLDSKFATLSRPKDIVAARRNNGEDDIAHRKEPSSLGQRDGGKNSMGDEQSKARATRQRAQNGVNDDEGAARRNVQRDHENAITDEESKPTSPRRTNTDSDANDESSDHHHVGSPAEKDGYATSSNIDDPTTAPRLIHILETRFMQMQPDLVELARARLRLLKSICLPTVLGQTAWGKFVWVIRTDPGLHDDVRRELVTMLEEAGALTTSNTTKNKSPGDEEEEEGRRIGGGGEEKEERALAYVIGSNDNFIVTNTTIVSPGLRPFDIRYMLSDALSKPESIFAGGAENTRKLLDEVSPNRIGNDVVVWTRLDADDGLNVDFMEYIQSQAIRYFLPERYDKEILKWIPKDGSSDDNGNDKEEEGGGNDDDKKERKMIENVFTPPKWAYWCAGKNIDWFLTDPIHDPRHKNGTVYPVLHANVCITPGVTMAMHGAFDPLGVPLLDHHDIISYLRPKGGKPCARTGLSVFDEEGTDDDEKEDEDDGSCFHMITGGISSVRARTPTSAGMMGVNPDSNQMGMVEKMPQLTPIMWTSIQREFDISNDHLLETNSYFAEHVYDIAEENARGQCTVGHSCKSSSKDRLEQYVDLKDEMRGGFDIVNGTIIIG